MVRRLTTAAFAILIALMSASGVQAQAPKVTTGNQLEAARELYASGNWETAREAYEEAYKKADENSILKAEAALEWGSLLWEQGDYRNAKIRVADALKRAKKLKLDHAVGRLLLTQGHIEASLGKLGDAETTLKICVKMARDQHDVHFETLCRINLRFVRQLRGRSVPPESQYQKDLKKLETSGEPLLVGTALAKTAEGFSKMGNHAAALDLLKRADAQFGKAGNVPAQTRNKLRKVQAYQEMGRWADAGNTLKGVILQLRNMRNNPSLVTAYALTARQHEETGDLVRALAMHQKSLKIAKKVGSPQVVGNANLGICEFHARHESYVETTSFCKEAEKIFAKTGVPDLQLRAKIAMARQAQLVGDMQRARREYVEIIESMKGRLKGNDVKRNYAIQYTNLCQVELKLKNNGARTRCRGAMKALKNVKATPNDQEYKRMLASTHYAIGALAYRDKKSQEAGKNLSKAAALYDELKQAPQATEAYLRLGRLQYRIKRHKEASKSFAAGLDRSKGIADLTEARVQIRIQYAQVLMDQESWEPAKEMLVELDREAKARKDSYSQAWGKSALARVELKLGNREAAIAALKAGLSLSKRAGDKDLQKSIEDNLKMLSK